MKTYGQLQLKDSQWELDKIPPFVAIRLKEVFPGIKKSSTMPFYFKNTIEVCRDLDWFINRYPMLMGALDLKNLKDGSSDHIKKANEVQKLFDDDYVPPVVHLKGGKLFPFQSQGVELFKKVDRLLVADEVGLGKTVEGIAAMVEPGNLPTLVCVQPHLTQQWKDEIEKWADLEVHIVNPKKAYKLPKADVYIFKYTNIYNWIDVILEMPIKLVILDEVQEIRRVESLKHEGVVKVSQYVPKVMGLSGSPIYNYGDEVWNIYQAIKPDIFPSKDVFVREWCGYSGKITNPEALGSYLLETSSYIRRTKADVFDQVPPVNKIVHTVGYDKKAVHDIEADAKILAQTVLDGSFVESGQAARELSIMLRKVTGVSKARDVANYVRIILENDEPVLLAGWHRDVYDIWNKELAEYNPVMYTGSESHKQKQESKRKFVEGESNLMFISLRSAGADFYLTIDKYIIICYNGDI